MTMCSECRAEMQDTRFKRCEECREKGRREMAAWRKKMHAHATKYQRDWQAKQRRNVIANYGGRCACCGETELEFLSIDHVNGGGTQHRLKHGFRGVSMYRYLIREGYPDGFRVLCHNCNQAIGFYGQCPHERAILEVIAGGLADG